MRAAFFRLVLGAALLFVGTPVALADVKFPPVGTSYQDARTALRKQGVRVEKTPDCVTPVSTSGKTWCFAVFREKTPDGWTHFIVAELDQSKSRVTKIRYAVTSEGLQSIPPPDASDIPKLKPPYYPVMRNQLLKLGYRPMQRLDTSFGKACVDYECKRFAMLPESNCSGTGYSYCSHLWLAPDGRVLHVITQGETVADLYRAIWTTRKEVRNEALTVSANPRPRLQRN